MSSTPPQLPSAPTLPSLPSSSLTPVLDLLFEPSPPLHTLTLPILRSTTFPSYPVLIAAINAQLSSLATSSDKKDLETLDEILCAHPRLGEKKVESALSRGEQAGLQSGGGGGDGKGEEEGEKLRALNEEYERVFPGLRYVVFVNARPRPVIMQNMRERIDRGDIAEERREAIQAMCDIAVDRAGKLSA